MIPQQGGKIMKLTNSNLYPKKCCATRWVENKCVADRLVEIWPDIRKLFRFWNTQKGPQPSQKTTKSIINVKAALEDPFTEAKIRVKTRYMKELLKFDDFWLFDRFYDKTQL